jgi:endonuclease/exonuclease/phosphatase family metal-dependent hydrolase
MNTRMAAVGAGLTIMMIVIGVFFVLGLQTPTDNVEPTDTEPPVITRTSPDNGSLIFGALALTFDAEDESRIIEYRIYIDGGDPRSAGQAYNWNSADVEDGQHNITFSAKDSALNVGMATVFVTVNNSQTPQYQFENTFKIMAYNIEESGINPDWKEVVKEENPDILMLVETGYLEDDGYALFDDALSEFNGYFSDEQPYSGLCALNIYYSTSGEAIMSRYPIVQFIQIPVVTLDNNETYDVTHDFVDAVIDINGTDVHFIGAHLKASGGEYNQLRRDYENEGIINYMDDLGDVPIVYLGDMNSYSPQDNITYDGNLGFGPLTMLVEPDDPVYGQYSSKVHNFTDAFRALNPDEAGTTYPYLGRIDYIIVNQFFTNRLVNSTVGDTPHADTGSDHYCVDLFLSWNGTGAVEIPLASGIEGNEAVAHHPGSLSELGSMLAGNFRKVSLQETLQVSPTDEFGFFFAVATLR